MKYLAIASSIFSFFLIHRRELRSQPIRGKVRRIGRIFPEHVERSFLDPEYSFVAVGRITRTILFAKQKFAQLRTNCIRRILPTPNYVREQMFAQLRTGFRLISKRRIVSGEVLFQNSELSLARFLFQKSELSLARGLFQNVELSLARDL